MIALIRTGPLDTNSLVVTLGNPPGRKAFIVDPACCGFSGDEGAISSYLEERGLEPQAIVLTHGHFDHVAGIPFLMDRYPGMRLYVHADDASFIGAGGTERQGRHLSLMGFQDFLPSVSGIPAATDLMADGDGLFGDYGSPWTVMHTPGHTEGSCVLYSEQEKVLISGDTLFYRSWGRTDLPGGNEGQIMRSLTRIYRELPGDTRVYPGHGRAAFLLEESPIL